METDVKKELEKILKEVNEVLESGRKAETLMDACQYYPLLAAAVKLKKLVQQA